MRKFLIKKTKGSEVIGITLNNKSQLYITDNFVITHNSTIATDLFLDQEKFLYETEQGRQLIEEWVKKGYNKPTYDIRNVLFSDYEFLDRVGKAQPLELIWKDEDYETTAQVGGRAMKERKTMLLSRLRGLSMNFLLLDPIFRSNDLSQLYNYRLYALDKDYEDKKNRAILYLKDLKYGFVPAGHIITDYKVLKGYDKKKGDQMAQIKKMQQPEFKRKQMRKIVDAMVHWKDPNTGEPQGIRDYQKGSWNGLIKLRLELMGKASFLAGTEIKEIKGYIDAFYPIKKEKDSK